MTYDKIMPKKIIINNQCWFNKYQKKWAIYNNAQVTAWLKLLTLRTTTKCCEEDRVWESHSYKYYYSIRTADNTVATTKLFKLLCIAHFVHRHTHSGAVIQYLTTHALVIVEVSKNLYWEDPSLYIS